MDTYEIAQICFGGLMVTGLLLLLAVLTKLNNGLFIARFIFQFKQDRYDPKYQWERDIGNLFSGFVFKYVPPFFAGFCIILILSYFL